MSRELQQALNEDAVRRLAGDRTYQRGHDYQSQGHVEQFADSDGVLRAFVKGSRDYTVRIRANGEALDYSCDCPVGAEGSFCKHCVAAALAWLRGGGTSEPGGGKRTETTLADVRKVLLSGEKNALVATILEWAETDKLLRDRLILYAAERAGSEASISAARKMFSKAVQARGFIPGKGVPAYARRVGRAIDVIEALLQDGQTAGVIGLCESAVTMLVHRSASVDDSSGYLPPLLQRIQGLHERACATSRPDPESLANTLFEWEFFSGFGIFSGVSSRYAETLGAEGLQVYRQLAERERARTSNA